MAGKQKEPSLKKIITEINDIGKKLSYSSIYLIDMDNNELISSSVKDTTETFNITVASLDEKYSKYLPYFRNAVDGSKLNRILNGTAVVVEVIDDTTISIKSKVKVKDEKEEMEWRSDEFCKHDIQYDINKKVSKIQRALKKIKNPDFYSNYEYNLDKLREQNKFLINISEKLNVSSLKITNKMMKTLNKGTIHIASHVTYPFNVVDDVNLHRIHIIETIEPQGIIRSYYPFVDRQHKYNS